MPQYNQFAPPAINGVDNPNPVGYSDVDFTYTFNVNLLASQPLVNQQVNLHTDADFILRAITYVSTGIFSYRFYDSQDFPLSDAQLFNGNLSADPSEPTVVSPELPFPAGSKIGIDITELSAAPNTVQIVFRGVKRFKLAQV